MSYNADMMLRIKELRGKLSQAELAAIAEVRAATVSDAENPNGNPTVKTLEKIAKALGVHIREVFPEDSSAPEITNETRIILESIGKLTPKQRDAVRDFLENMTSGSSD